MDPSGTAVSADLPAVAGSAGDGVVGRTGPAVAVARIAAGAAERTAEPLEVLVATGTSADTVSEPPVQPLVPSVAIQIMTTATVCALRMVKANPGFLPRSIEMLC